MRRHSKVVRGVGDASTTSPVLACCCSDGRRGPLLGEGCNRGGRTRLQLRRNQRMSSWPGGLEDLSGSQQRQLALLRSFLTPRPEVVCTARRRKTATSAAGHRTKGIDWTGRPGDSALTPPSPRGRTLRDAPAVRTVGVPSGCHPCATGIPQRRLPRTASLPRLCRQGHQ